MHRLAYQQIVSRLINEDPRFAIDEVTINGLTTKVWRAAFDSLRGVLERSYQYGDAPYLVYERERISYQQHYHLVCGLARKLVTEFDLKPGERVALAMRNLPEWPVIFWATVSVGAIIVPLNAWWEASELAYAINDCSPKVLFADEQRWQKLAGLLHQLPVRHFVVSRSDCIETPARDYRALIAGASEHSSLPPIDILADDPATLFYTSGTTGEPKGALGTHRNICNNLISAAFHKTVAQLRRGDTGPPARPTGV